MRLLGFSDARELLSADPMEVRGRYEMLAEDGSELPIERLPGRRALLGERPPPLTVRYRHHGSAEDRWSRVQSTPVFDERGAVRLAINVIEDITEIKRAELGQRFLAEASHALNASLDHHQTLQDVARLAVPTVADWCAVDLVAGDDLERVAVAHVDPERVTMARELQERYPPDPDAVTGVYAVVRFGRAELYREVSDELLVRVARDEEHLALLRTVGLRSAMLAPMTLRDRVLGVITFASAESGRGTTRWTSRSRRIWPCGPPPRSRTRACTRRPRRSPARSRRRSCRRSCPSCRAPSWRRCTDPRAGASRWAATSTTCSASPRISGTWWSATSAARAPRRRP